jgi:uncharacterized protein (TIGR02145 family)
MKKIFFLMLTLLIWNTASMNAQVLIGLGDEPDGSAILELRSNNLGLLFPRVALQSTEDKETIDEPVAGLAVYNTANAGSGATAVVPGIYVFTGTAWTLQAPPVIKTQPAAFTFRRLYDVSGDPNAPKSPVAITLSVEAGGATSYQWYVKSKNMNVPATAIADATSADYTPTSTLTDWGLYQYYCVVSNAYGSVKSDVAEIAVGCGAKTSDNTWLKFMCHNLGASPVGADQSLDEITFDTNATIAGGDTISSDAKGWLFQWGRIADGHQWRSSATVPGPVILPADDTPIPSNNEAYGKFITISNDPYDWRTPQREFLWRNRNDGRFPCPPGWRIPSSSEWGSIYRTGDAYGAPGTGAANTWYWENKGYGIRPDNSTTTLFLPAAGYRARGAGALGDAGVYGNYWSCSYFGTRGVVLWWDNGNVRPFTLDGRAVGSSVRCLAE